MNERIVQLAGHNERIRDFFETGPVQRAAVEDFALLIIRDCVEQILSADVGDLQAKDYYLNRVAEHVERHFGTGQEELINLGSKE